MPLTKSNFITFLDSPLHLWLSLQPDITPKSLSEYDQLIITQGKTVEKLAKQFLEHKVRTEYPPGSTISFEVTLTDGNFQSRIDALVHDMEHDTYDMYEIKSSSTTKPHHKQDVTFQYLIGKAQLPVYKMYLVKLNSEYRRSGEIEREKLFVVEDMMGEVEKRQHDVYTLRSDAWDIYRLLTAPTEDHCLNPSTCPYPSHCFSDLPEYSIYDLVRGSKKQISALNGLDIKLVKDIPDDFTRNFKQLRQIQSARIQQPIIDNQAITHELQTLEYPLYFLDYETYNEAVPMFDGYKPYQHAVTQYSLHVVSQADSNTVDHYEFLATEHSDPSLALATSLCSVIGPTGTIIVWNKTFECTRNKEMSALYSQFADQLNNINARTYDLMEIFSKGLYVDYRFHGSASIKTVLPILCPELSYKELEVNNGTTAMLQWHDMVYGNLSEEEKEKIKKNLLTYCKLDTWAMVEIWRWVKAIPSE